MPERIDALADKHHIDRNLALANRRGLLAQTRNLLWVTAARHQNGGGLGANGVNWITEQIAGTQQLGTHLDALSHLQIG